MHPFRQRHASATTGGNTKGVEPGADEKVLQLRCLAEDEVPIRGETLGSVDQLVHARRLQRRHAAHREAHCGGEMVEVRVEKCELKALRNAARRPRDRVRFVTTHHQRPDLFLVIGEPVGVSQGRQITGNTVELRGDYVLVLHGNQRHVDAHRGSKISRPLTGAAHHNLAGNAAVLGDHSADLAVGEFDPHYLGVFQDRGPSHPGAAGQRLGDI